MTETDFLNEAPGGTEFTYHVGKSLAGVNQDWLWIFREAYNEGRITFKQRNAYGDKPGGQPRTFAYVAEKLRYPRVPKRATGKGRPRHEVHLFKKGVTNGQA